MTLAPSTIRPDFRHPVLLHRGNTTVVPFRLRQGGALLTPASGTVDVYRALDQVFALGLALTPGTTSTATVPLIVSAEAIGEGWSIRLNVTIGTSSYSWRQSAIVVGDIPSPVIDDEDLYVEQAELRRRFPEGQTNWNPQIDEGWQELLYSLTSGGRQPWNSINSVDAREAHKALSLAKACGNIISEDGFFERKAKEWADKAANAIAAIRMTYEDLPTVHKGQAVTRRGERGRSWSA